MKSRQLLKGALLLAVLFISNEIFAQLDFSGEFRPRTELRDGYKTLPSVDAKAAFFTSQRTRLNLYYKNDDFKVGFSLQDVRTWGDTKQLNTTDNHLFIHEAWGQYFLSKEFSIKMGRQELIYDDHRIFGSVGWAQQARSHDMFLFKYKSGIDIHAGFAFHQNSEAFNSHFDGNDAYKSLQFLWLHHEWDVSKLSFMLLNNGIAEPSGGLTNVESQDVMYSQTIGGRFQTELDAVKVAANAYVQTGKDNVDRDLSAYNVLLEVSGKISESTGITGGFEVLSGTGYDEEVDKNKSFTPFYGTNHKFNGLMDYFYVGNHTDNVGLIDIYVPLTYHKDKFTATLSTHFFSAEGDILNPDNTIADSYLGTELDFSAAYKLIKSVTLNLGYSQMFATESMELLKGGSKNETNNWGWVMITFKPNFFTKKFDKQ